MLPTNPIRTQKSEIVGHASEIVDNMGGPQGPQPSSSKDNMEHQVLKEENHRIQDELRQARATIENYDRELKRRDEELHQARHENKMSKVTIAALQNELINVHQQLEDAKALSGSQSSKDDTLLSISDKGEKVTALTRNEENSQAAAIIHKPHELSVADSPQSQAHSHAQVARSKDLQHPQGAIEDTSARGSAHNPSAKRSQDAQAHLGHHPEDGKQDRSLLETRITDEQSTPQVPGYVGQRFKLVDTFMSFIPTRGPQPPKDKYQTLKEEYYRIRDELRQSLAIIENYDRELKRGNGALRQTSQYVGHLQHECQLSKDSNNDLQNELNDVHQQLKDAKTLSDLSGSQSSKDDTLSISDVGEIVAILDEEIFQAAATLGEFLIHKHHELSQADLVAAVAVSQEMVGGKVTNVLMKQSLAQKGELEVNPLLVQVVLQIFMVKFCVSKLQSWYPGDSVIGDFLATIHSEIRLTGKHRIEFTKFCLTYNNF
jgi:molecular chaperone GrpE (heat shock protein)